MSYLRSLFPDREAVLDAIGIIFVLVGFWFLLAYAPEFDHTFAWRH